MSLIHDIESALVKHLDQLFTKPLQELGQKIMASIEQVHAELANATLAITDLKSTIVAEKQEIHSKLTDLEGKISEQSQLIESLQTKANAGEIPEDLLAELTDVTDGLKAATAEIKGLVEPETKEVGQA